MKNLLPGAFMARKKDQTIYYRSSITYRKKHISLGSYDTMMDAHLCYLEASDILSNPTQEIIHYHDTQLLRFEKRVSLINFRDNGIYFCNPIYVRQKFFYYYLSPSTYLIFDIYDLFY